MFHIYAHAIYISHIYNLYVIKKTTTISISTCENITSTYLSSEAKH